MSAATILADLGFEPDLGPAWSLALADGTTVLVAGYDTYGEPDSPSLGPAFAQRLVDANDHGTLIEEVERDSLVETLAQVRTWVSDADARKVGGA